MPDFIIMSSLPVWVKWIAQRYNGMWVAYDVNPATDIPVKMLVLGISNADNWITNIFQVQEVRNHEYS